MEHISITQYKMVKNHPYLKAIIDLRTSGLQLRGLRLEEGESGELSLGFPGRKIQGQWQVVYETDDQVSNKALLDHVQQQYEEWQKAA